MFALRSNRHSSSRAGACGIMPPPLMQTTVPSPHPPWVPSSCVKNFTSDRNTSILCPSNSKSLAFTRFVHFFMYQNTTLLLFWHVWWPMKLHCSGNLAAWKLQWKYVLNQKMTHSFVWKTATVASRWQAKQKWQTCVLVVTKKICHEIFIKKTVWILLVWILLLKVIFA